MSEAEPTTPLATLDAIQQGHNSGSGRDRYATRYTPGVQLYPADTQLRDQLKQQLEQPSSPQPSPDKQE